MLDQLPAQTSVNLNKHEPLIKKKSTGRTSLFSAPFVAPMCLLEQEGSGEITKVIKESTPACIARFLNFRVLGGVQVC